MPPASVGRLRRARRLSLALSCVALCAAPAVVAEIATASSAPDTSFETTAAGWSASGGTLSRVRAGDAPDGRTVARLARHRGSGPLTLTDRAIVANAATGRSYLATAWVRAAAPGSIGERAVIRVVQRSADGRVVRRTTSSPVRLGRTFRRVGVTVTASPRAAGSTCRSPRSTPVAATRSRSMTSASRRAARAARWPASAAPSPTAPSRPTSRGGAATRPPSPAWRWPALPTARTPPR